MPTRRPSCGHVAASRIACRPARMRRQILPKGCRLLIGDQMPSRGADPRPQQTIRSTIMPPHLLNAFMQMLLRGERRACRQIVHEALGHGVPAAAVIQKLIWPAMEEVDRLYREDQINIATEHMATRINRFLADQIQAYLPRTDANG